MILRGGYKDRIAWSELPDEQRGLERIWHQYRAKVKNQTEILERHKRTNGLKLSEIAPLFFDNQILLFAFNP
jgi:hypothetical protein